MEKDAEPRTTGASGQAAQGNPGPGKIRPPSDSARDARFVAMLLTDLAELERSTNPDAGVETAAQKGIRAFRALHIAGQLVRAVAGWAIDHYYGMSMRGLSFVPTAPPTGKDHPEFLNLRKMVDDHQLEKDGILAQRCREPIDSLLAQRLLYNLLYTNPGGFPRELQYLFMEGLRALELGERLPLFEPNAERKYSKVRYRELQLQLSALAFVEYRVKAFRLRKTDALADVAAAYEVDPKTISDWKTSVKEKLGSL